MSAPSRLGRYPVRRRLGAGAFATVWLAHDEHLDSEVAIKVLADNWTEDLHVRRRFVEEGRFLRKVESRHVVNVYDAGELDDGRPFLVMSYADAGTLADRLEVGRLSTAEALHVVDQVGQGLAALHDRGVLHRDVKPANVLFRTVGHGSASELCAMLGDLGLGKAMDMSSRLTMIGGTPTFVAPEQARGEGLDARADQYSLAALAYLLLAGRRPFEHESLTAAADPLPPTPLGDGFPADAGAVLRKALSPDREQRYDDVLAFVAALTEALGSMPAERSDAARASAPDSTRVTSYPTDPTQALAPGAPAGAPVRRHGAAGLVAGAVVLAVGVGAGWAVERLVGDEQRLEDTTGTISVTVPEAWTSEVRPESWTPPEGETRLPSLSAGVTSHWNTAGRAAPGVFVGIVEGEDLPASLPQHDECESQSSPVTGVQGGGESVTQRSTGCPGADVTVERVVKLDDSRLAWVQVRSDDASTATRVLDSIELRPSARQ